MKRVTYSIIYLLVLISGLVSIMSCVSSQQARLEQLEREELQRQIDQSSSIAWEHLFSSDLESTIEEFTTLSDKEFFTPSVIRGLAVGKIAWQNGTDIYPLIENLIHEQAENPYTLALLNFANRYCLYEHEQYSQIITALSRQLTSNSSIPSWLKREYSYYLFDYYFNKTGSFVNAENIKSDLAVIDGWEILGPFSNVSGSGYLQDFIETSGESWGFPETVQGGLNNWTLESFSPECGNKDIFLPVSKYLSSLNYTSAYAYKKIIIEEEGAFQLILSRKGSVECWLDGEKIYEDASYREARNDCYIPLNLSAGEHDLLVKLNNREEGTYFNVSLIPSLEEEKGNSPLYESLFPERTNYDPLLQDLCVRAEEENAPVESWFWLYLTLLSKDRHEQAAQIYPHLERKESPLSNWMQAMYYQAIGEWTLFDREMVALGEEGVLAPAIEYLMDSYISLERFKILEDYLDDFKEDRLYYQRTIARMKKAIIFGDNEVMTHYYKLTEKYPHTALSHLLILNMNYRISYNEKNNFISFLKTQGYYKTALLSQYTIHSYNATQNHASLSAYLAHYTDEEWVWRDYLALLSNEDNYSLVSEESRKALGSFPYSYDLLNIEYDRSNWLYHSMKQYYDENRAKILQSGSSGQRFTREMRDEEDFYREALEKMVGLFPYNLYIRDELRELNGQETFIHNILHKDSLERIQYYEEQNWDSGESDAVIVMDYDNEVYFGDGSSYYEQHLIMKVNTPQGVEDNRYYYLPFYYNGYNGMLREAFVLKADGSRVFPNITGYKIAFSGLEPGDYFIIRYTYSAYNKGDLNNQFWSSKSLARRYPVFQCKYQMIYPEDREIHIQEHNLDADKLKMETKDFIEGYKALEITSNKVDAVSYGIMTPSWRDITPWVDITSVDSWETIIQWYDKLTRGQTEASYQLRQTVESLCRDSTSEREKIQRIFSFVSAGIEYEDLDFMYTAQIPQTADSVLKEGYGDCKDQTALLVAMLKIAGIDSYFMLSSPGYKGGAPYQPSGRFSHVIAAVDMGEETLFLDPTTSSYTLGEIPASMKGTYVLPIIPDHELIPLEPTLEEQQSLVLMEFDNLLGTPQIWGDFSLRGDLAGYYRYRLRGETESRSQEIFQLMLNEWLPGFQLTELSIGNLDDLYYDPSARFSGSSQTLLIPAMNGGIRQLSFPWLNILDDVQHAWIALEGAGSGVALEDYKTSSPVTQILMYHLPASGRVQALPDDQSFEYGDSYIRYSYKQEGNLLICTRDLWIQENYVPQDQLEAFQAFILQGLLKENENGFIRF